MSARSVKIALVQMSMSAAKAANLEKAADRIREPGARGADLVCLPELFAAPYFCQSEDASNFDLAEPMNGPTTQAMAEAARDAKVAVVVPFFERRAAGVYHNSLVVVGRDGAVAGSYRKMHIPDDPLFYEKYYFTPGDLGFRTIESGPEAARLTAMSGAETLVYPTAIGWHPSEKAEYGAAQVSAWQTMQRAHAISNGLFVVAVHGVGHEGEKGGGVRFW